MHPELSVGIRRLPYLSLCEHSHQGLLPLPENWDWMYHSVRSTVLSSRQISKTNLEEPMQYLVIIEEAVNSYGAYVPDLPGCVAVGETKAEVHKLITEAIPFHIEGLRKDGDVVPPPSSTAAFIDIATG